LQLSADDLEDITYKNAARILDLEDL
jgi:hypothetical protein